MANISGSAPGHMALLGQFISPVQQQPLSSTVLGMNNYVDGAVYNEVHCGQPVASAPSSLTVSAYGSSPSAGIVTLAVLANGVAVFSQDIPSALWNTQGPSSGSIFPVATQSYPAATDITVTATTSADFAQSSGGLLVSLWGFLLV